MSANVWQFLPDLDGAIEAQAVGSPVTVSAGRARVMVRPLWVEGRGLSVELEATAEPVPVADVEAFLEAFGHAVRRAAAVAAPEGVSGR